jgi:hypothetical protein
MAGRTDPGVGWAPGPVFEEARRCRKRVTEMPGFLVEAAQQMVTEVGADAAAFPSSAQFCSGAGVGPGSEESAEQNRSSRSAQGNGFVRRILPPAAQAAVKAKGSPFQNLFHRLVCCLNSAVTARLGPWLTAGDVYFGRFSRMVSATSNTATRQRLKPRNAVPKG